KSLNDLELTWESAYWRYASGVAANFSNPAEHQADILFAESNIDANRGLFAEEARNLARMDSGGIGDPGSEPYGTCWGGPGNPPAAQGPGTEQGSQACPKQLKAVKLVFKIDEVFKLGFTCETVDLDITPPAWI